MWIDTNSFANFRLISIKRTCGYIYTSIIFRFSHFCNNIDDTTRCSTSIKTNSSSRNNLNSFNTSCGRAHAMRVAVRRPVRRHRGGEVVELERQQRMAGGDQLVIDFLLRVAEVAAVA